MHNQDQLDENIDLGTKVVCKATQLNENSLKKYFTHKMMEIRSIHQQILDKQIVYGQQQALGTARALDNDLEKLHLSFHLGKRLHNVLHLKAEEISDGMVEDIIFESVRSLTSSWSLWLEPPTTLSINICTYLLTQ